MKRALVVFLLLLIIGGGIGAYIYVSQPKTPAEWLTAARAAEARNAAKIVTLEASTEPADKAKAATLQQETLEAYAQVGRRFPGAPEVEDADWRVLELKDEKTTGPEDRIELYKTFIDRHTSTTREAELRWRMAELTHRELKRQLQAIELYGKFVSQYPKDPRAPEALYRIGQIYEEIREFNKAVEAYRRVTKEYPQSPVADQAQFRVGALLAEKLEKKEEAAAAFEELAKKSPGSRMGAAAAGEGKKLAAKAGQSAQDKARQQRYGMSEVSALDSFLAELDSPPFQQLRSQRMDLLHSDLRLNIVPFDQALSGSASMRFLPAETTATMVVHLGSPIQVTSATREDGRPLRFSRQGDFVFLDFEKEPLKGGTTSTIQLAWKGECLDSWGPQIITSASTFLIGYHLAPRLNLGDGSTADMTITVPTGWEAVGSGLPGDVLTPAPGYRSYQFQHRQPTYFLGLAISAFHTTSANYETKGRDGKPRTIKIETKFYASDTTASDALYLKEIPKILAFYESKFGPYPFDRLAVARVNNFPGGLSCPGLILLGPSAFEKSDVTPSFLAHEVAHAWFGNLLGLDLGNDSPVWLSEGIAEYCDALYEEHTLGRAALVRLMRERAELYFATVSQVTERSLSELRGNIGQLSAIHYLKGAYTMHMLRGVMGDEAFFSMLRRFVEDHRFGTVTTSDLRQAVRQATKEDLGYFFQEWVDGTGLPRYVVTRACRVAGGKKGAAKVEVEIVQKGKAFDMPLEVRLETTGRPVTKRIRVSGTTTSLTLESPDEPVRVVVDPDSWVLKHPRLQECELPVSPDCTAAAARPDTETTASATTSKPSKAD